MGSYFFDKRKKAAAGVLAACIYMVAFPEITMEASKTAISIWLNSIVPVILPFFTAAGFLKRTGACDSLTLKVYPFAMAALSGYPMGAKICGDYYREGRISEEELGGILSFTMITGPAFIVGTVGFSLLGSYRAGVILAASHYAGAILNGFVYGGYKVAGKCQSPTVFEPQENKTFCEHLTDSMLESFRSAAVILGYIMLFMIACRTASEFVFVTGLRSSQLFSEAEAVATGLLEMTVGCGKIAETDAGSLFKITGAEFIISFGGFSVTGQTMSMLKKCPVSAARIMKIKFTHGFFSAITAFALCRFMII